MSGAHISPPSVKSGRVASEKTVPHSVQLIRSRDFMIGTLRTASVA